MRRSLLVDRTRTNIGSYETVISSDTIRTKIENATEGLCCDCFNLLFVRISPMNRENALIICEYIFSLRSEINPSNGYRRNNVVLLSKLSIYFKNAKLFKAMTREDLLSFLDSFRKTETVDPLHKWIGTYNLYRVELMRFFKWLYSPDVEQHKRPKPPVIENIPQLNVVYIPKDLDLAWIMDDA